jgi:hypothetical protein
MAKAKQAGRPRGKAQRKCIELPSGDALVPLFSTFKEEVGLSAKCLQRMRKRFKVTVIGGVAYVHRNAALQVLAEPKRVRR